MRRLFLGLGVFSFLGTLVFFSVGISSLFVNIEFTKGDAIWTAIFMLASAVGFAGSLKE